MDRSPAAAVEDVHAIASRMPYAKLVHGGLGNDRYCVGRVWFVIFRAPRDDAVDPASGEPYDDVIILRVPSESDKAGLLQDASKPFFTTPHFENALAVMIRGSKINCMTRAELGELVHDAWLSSASPRRAAAWLREQGFPNPDRLVSKCRLAR